MDKPIPEAALQAARVAYGSSMPDDERMRAALAAAIPHLTATQQPDHIVDAAKMVAQQQGQAVALDRMAIRLLVAAGFVTEDKANEALRIAHGFDKGPLAPPSAPVDELPDCPHSALDGCDCYATQNQEPPMTAETDLLPCRCGNTKLHVARFLGACRVVCRRCEEQTSYSRNHVDMWNRKMKREKDRE